jgi:hypothetical protein
MHVAQELSDRDLYDWPVLSGRFDPASRVSSYRSKFPGRVKRYQEDADSFADALNILCWCGYSKSSVELRSEHISEKFIRGKSDPELQRHLLVVMRSQPERGLQALVEICTDFGNMTSAQRLQMFAISMEAGLVLAINDNRWSGSHNKMDNFIISPKQLMELAKKMRYEMRPVARRQNQSVPTGRPANRQRKDWSKVKCFSCGVMGHTKARCQAGRICVEH